ncbi:porin [Malikia sp.]|uniref:porin n=1 Tax=Malikia sp. TaxID=2070706 RepID=UPI002625051F|nr:porin [Malikia sp.]MDD2729771.1 porin [Malikia sp.]
MKKSLIAMAVLAAAGAASAQSSVQLYGIADVWVGAQKIGAAKAQTVVESGGVDASRFGLKGSEDLGGGLKAIFTLEQGFNLDTGAQATAGQAFSREASVGVAGNFGTVKLGKVWTAYDDVQNASNPVFDSALTPSAGAFATTAAATGYLANPANGIKYTSPSFAGVTGIVSYALDENTAGNAEVSALAVQYANGPLAAAVAYQNQQAVGFVNSIEFTNLNASYNLGVVTLKGSYAQRDNNNGIKDKEYQLGVDYPLASNLILSAGYASSENKDKGVKQSDNSGLGLAAAYLLSKRTTAYAGVRSTKLDHVNAAIADVTTNVYAVGVKHAF